MTKPNVFQLIDLDRTLFDTPRFVKALTDEINLTQPGLGTQLDERFEAAYAKEETFFLLRYLRREKGDEWFEELVERAVNKVGARSLLLPGARERLAFADTLSSASPAWGILTYGDKVDQLLKLRLIGLEHVPVYFSRTPNKGEVLRSWRTEHSTFQLPTSFGGKVVEILTLEDDKLRAFQALPKGAIGLWVAAPGKKGHASESVPAANVVLIQSLFESIAYLKKRFM